jgi:hypothetical protein
MNQNRAIGLSRRPRICSVAALLVALGAASSLPACTAAEETGGDDGETAAASSALTSTNAQYFTEVGNALGPFMGLAMASGHYYHPAGPTYPYRDLAIGVPGFSEVRVRTGGSAGLSTTESAVFKQGSGGIPGTFSYDDNFGKALARGDFNGDGYDDLAIGAPDDPVTVLFTTYSSAGSVTIVYGPFNSPALPPKQFTRASPNVPGDPEYWEEFGSALAAGDFNGDGYDDLAIGSPMKDTSGQSDAGSVVVIHGTSSGLDANAGGGALAAKEWSQDSAGVSGAAEANDRFGSALAAGDFDGNGADDLAIGVPGEAIGSLSNSGAVNVLYGVTGSSGGLSSSKQQLWTGSGDGLAYTAYGGNEFGISLAAGKFNTDAYEDLVIGAPWVDVGSASDAGAVVVIYGASTGTGVSGAGLSSATDQLITQDSNKVAGTAEAGDHCGWSVTVADFNGDGDGDIAFGCPDEVLTSGHVQDGAFDVIYGPLFVSTFSPTGELWSQDISGLSTTHSGANFGQSLAAGDFNGDGKADAAACAPVDSGGSVTILRGN